MYTISCIIPVFEETAAIRWGNAFESAVIELAETARRDTITDRERFCWDTVNDFITCHIDGRYNEPILHEGKTTSLFYYKDNFGEPGTDQVPIEYQIQGQHQMICTGAEKVILSVLVFPRRVDSWEEEGWEIEFYKLGGHWILKNNDINFQPHYWASSLSSMGYFHQYEINANKELQKIMIEYYTEFWNKNVLERTPPRPQSYDDIKSMVVEPVGTIIADEYITKLSHEYKDIQKEIGASGDLAKRKEWIKVKVLDYIVKTTPEAIDDDSEKKFKLVDAQDNKLFQYDGKAFR